MGTGRSGPGAGRPTKLYTVPPETEAIEFPERHYDRLLGHLAGQLPEDALTQAGVSFGALPGGNGWSRVTTCLTATSNHTDVRIAFEPGPRSPTLGIDTVDIR